MRALALCVALLAGTALGQLRAPHIASNGGLSKHFPSLGGNGVVLSYLQTVAAADECTGTSPTTLQGGSLTFTRASDAYCTKTDGTLVLLTTDQPRIEPGGLLVEAAVTNSCIRSQEMDNGAWTTTNVTVTANAGAAPWGAAVAERLASTSNGGFIESTSAALTGGAAIGSVYVKTESGTQTVAIRLRNTTANSDACTGTLVATTTYQRVACDGLITTGNNHSLRIYPGGLSGQGTIIAVGGQQEVTADGSSQARATSYVATVGTAVTRALETASMAMPTSVNNTVGCIGATVTRLSTLSVASPRILDFDNSNPMYVGSATAFGGDDGANTVDRGTCTSIYTSLGGTVRVTFAWSGGLTMTGTTCSTGTATNSYDGTLFSTRTLYLGAQSGTSAHLNANVSDVRVGTRPGACL